MSWLFPVNGIAARERPDGIGKDKIYEKNHDFMVLF